MRKKQCQAVAIAKCNASYAANGDNNEQTAKEVDIEELSAVLQGLRIVFICFLLLKPLKGNNY